MHTVFLYTIRKKGVLLTELTTNTERVRERQEKGYIINARRVKYVV